MSAALDPRALASPRATRDAHPVIAEAIAVGAGAAWLGWLIAKYPYRARDRMMRRAMACVPATPIAAFRDGMQGKLIGRVRVRQPVRAPSSGRLCAYFESVHESSTHNRPWRELHRHAAGSPFTVVDESGEALVLVDHCEVVLLPDYEVRGREIATYMERRREGILADGERVAVIGYGKWEPDPDPNTAPLGYRERPVKLIVRGSARRALLITDKPTIIDS